MLDVSKRSIQRDMQFACIIFRFNMDTDPIPDLEYLKRSILGGRQYCLKEPLTTLPKARRQLKV